MKESKVTTGLNGNNNNIAAPRNNNRKHIYDNNRNTKTTICKPTVFRAIIC